jgi:hypothetical protein
LHVKEVNLTYTNVDPNTLNLSSNGNTIKVVLQLPEEYDPHDVDIHTVSIDGVLFCNPSPVSYSDENGDGIQELVLKFDRSDFEGLAFEGDAVPVTVTGEVHDQTWFTGTDTMRCIHPQITTPNGGDYLLVGHSVTLSWDSPTTGTPTGYDVWLSRDGGFSWEQLVSGLRANQYAWSIDGASTSQALVRVYAVDNQGVMGYDTRDAVFTIADLLQPPADVTDLVFSRGGATTTLHWKAPGTDVNHGPATSYRILTASSASGLFQELATTTNDSFDQPIDSEPGSIVFYKVVAVNAAGEAQ